MKKAVAGKYLFLVLGSFLLYFTGLRYSFSLAPWVTMVFFIFYFRGKNRWYEYLPIILLLFIPKFFIIHKGWDIPMWMELAATVFTMVPLMAALILDKFLYNRTSRILSTLVFPATYVVFDWLIGKSLFGTFSSIAITQFGFKPLLQLAAVTGMEGIAFVVLWTSSTIATLWEQDFDLQKAKRLLYVFCPTVLGILLIGGIYYAFSIPSAETVKVAGITIGHQTDFSSIIDMNTPKTEIEKHQQEIEELNDSLFRESEKAVQIGAKIIFWSEIDGILYEGNKEAFMERARSFAASNDIYFFPSVLVFHYDSEYAENKIIMFTPEGEIAFEYEKTLSWYTTHSDGIIQYAETPYGRVGSAICFDADFPALLRQAAKARVDILLNPKYDTRLISPGHTYSGFMRAIEGGYSMVSQVNEGVSMATDYRGNILAYQDFFTAKDRIMLADVPTKGRRTLYGELGDWFVYACIIFTLLVVLLGVRKGKKAGNSA